MEGNAFLYPDRKEARGKGNASGDCIQKSVTGGGIQYPEHQDTAYGRSISAVQYQETGRNGGNHTGKNGLLPELLRGTPSEYSGSL